MSGNTIETCYEYFNCKELNCMRRDHPSKQCWEIVDVKCQSHSEQFELIKKQVKNKLEACKLCMYYKEYN